MRERLSVLKPEKEREAVKSKSERLSEENESEKKRKDNMKKIGKNKIYVLDALNKS